MMYSKTGPMIAMSNTLAPQIRSSSAMSRKRLGGREETSKLLKRQEGDSKWVLYAGMSVRYPPRQQSLRAILIFAPPSQRQYDSYGYLDEHLITFAIWGSIRHHKAATITFDYHGSLRT